MHAEVIDAGYATDAAPGNEDFAMKLAAYGLLQGDTTEEAAERAGVSERTVFRWKHRPEFQAFLATAQAEVLADARQRLVALTGKAVATVERVMQDATAKGAPTQLAAAFGVLDRANVEVAETRQEGVRRIVSRLPEKQSAQVIAPTPPVAEAQSPPATPQRQPITIMRGGVR